MELETLLEQIKAEDNPFKKLALYYQRQATFNENDITILHYDGEIKKAFNDILEFSAKILPEFDKNSFFTKHQNDQQKYSDLWDLQKNNLDVFVKLNTQFPEHLK